MANDRNDRAHHRPAVPNHYPAKKSGQIVAHDHQTTIDHAADIETVSDDALDSMRARLESAAAAVRALPNPSAEDQDLCVLAARVRIEHRKRQARRAILGAGKAA